jgi:hypothetical protein
LEAQRDEDGDDMTEDEYGDDMVEDEGVEVVAVGELKLGSSLLV